LKNIKLLECTLRDGTYVVDFMIDTETFFSFTQQLIATGFRDIEVGHGLGLGAYRTHSAGFTDEELYKRLAPLASQARLYSFFIPYVGRPDDFRLAREYGLYGLRIGTEPVYLQDSLPAIEQAKALGYFVTLNLMKSYSVTPDGLAQLVAGVKDLVDVVYLVDSAGHLLPDELRAYVRAIQDRVGMIPLGYHGHNNLGLAVASALELIKEGVEYIDTTLTGIGRSGGQHPHGNHDCGAGQEVRRPILSGCLFIANVTHCPPVSRLRPVQGQELGLPQRGHPVRLRRIPFVL